MINWSVTKSQPPLIIYENETKRGTVADEAAI